MVDLLQLRLHEEERKKEEKKRRREKTVPFIGTVGEKRLGPLPLISLQFRPNDSSTGLDPPPEPPNYPRLPPPVP
jgi:hypothetical protein